MDNPQEEADEVDDLQVPIEELVLGADADPVMEGVLDLPANHDKQLPLNFSGEGPEPPSLDAVLQSSYEEATQILADCKTPQKAGEIAALVAKSQQVAWAMARGDLVPSEVIDEYDAMGKRIPISALAVGNQAGCICKDLLEELKLLINSFLEAVRLFEEERREGNLSGHPGVTENVSREPGYRSGDRFREHFSSFINELSRLFRDKIQVLWGCLVSNCSCVCMPREQALAFDIRDPSCLRFLKDKCEKFLMDHTFAFHYYTVNKY